MAVVVMVAAVMVYVGCSGGWCLQLRCMVLKRNR